MNTDELRPILAAYRGQVEKAWSEDTAHQYHKGLPGSPDGQCGVTSAWLKERLTHDHGISSAFCIGAVWINHSWTPEHCWLEVEDTDRLILDLTGDQFGLPKVTWDTSIDLWERDRVLYAAHEMRAVEVPDSLQPRLRRLKEAL